MLLNDMSIPVRNIEKSKIECFGSIDKLHAAVADWFVILRNIINYRNSGLI